MSSHSVWWNCDKNQFVWGHKNRFSMAKERRDKNTYGYRAELVSLTIKNTFSLSAFGKLHWERELLVNPFPTCVPNFQILFSPPHRPRRSCSPPVPSLPLWHEKQLEIRWARFPTCAIQPWKCSALGERLFDRTQNRFLLPISHPSHFGGEWKEILMRPSYRNETLRFVRSNLHSLLTAWIKRKSEFWTKIYYNLEKS